jgi:rubrerythrin
MVVDYIETFADEMIFGGEDDPVLSISSDAELEEVLDIAIRKEMESVMFYLGMKEAVRDDQARRKVDQIIWEELSHYAALKTELARLRGKLN